jgi:RNA polymerase sigma factor (sigma-70 family)
VGSFSVRRATQPAETLRAAVLSLLSDGQPRSTREIRHTLEKHRPLNPGSLHTEIFTLRKLGLVRSKGQGRTRQHKRTSIEPATERPKAATAPRKPRPKRSAATAATALNAEQIYGASIRDHQLLTPTEELDLSRRLELTEIDLWQRLIAGPLVTEAKQLLLALEPPVRLKSARKARAADLDRLIVLRVLAPRTDDPHASCRADLRPVAAEAARIREHFATCNLRLVLATILRHGYQHATSLSMSDLIQEGNLGLVKAVPRFNYRRGFRFSTFATWWIRHFLVRARQNGDEVRVPVHLQDMASKVRRAKLDLRKVLGREPTEHELATALKLPVKSLRSLGGDWLKHREALPSFDSVGGGDGEGELPSYLASVEPLADEVLARTQEDGRLVAAVAQMSPILAQIVRRRFGLDGAESETLFQIGKALNLSRERIRQLEKKALGILRKVLGEPSEASEGAEEAA